jgi:hypothetical protein
MGAKEGEWNFLISRANLIWLCFTTHLGSYMKLLHLILLWVLFWESVVILDQFLLLQLMSIFSRTCTLLHPIVLSWCLPYHCIHRFMFHMATPSQTSSLIAAIFIFTRWTHFLTNPFLCVQTSGLTSSSSS